MRLPMRLGITCADKIRRLMKNGVFCGSKIATSAFRTVTFVVVASSPAASQIETPQSSTLGHPWHIECHVTPSFGYGTPQKLALDMTGSLFGVGPTYIAGPYATLSAGVGATRQIIGYSYARGTLALRGGVGLLHTKSTPL